MLFIVLIDIFSKIAQYSLYSLIKKIQLVNRKLLFCK